MDASPAFPQALLLSNLCWIVCSITTGTVPKITTFRDWLLAEAAEDAHRLESSHPRSS
jgi:LysR family glycine cleavage system transcriptional activator